MHSQTQTQMNFQIHPQQPILTFTIPCILYRNGIQSCSMKMSTKKEWMAVLESFLKDYKQSEWVRIADIIDFIFSKKNFLNK